MPVRRRDFNVDDQLDLFSNQRLAHEIIDPIRTDGRETLARTLPENGARPGGEGTVAPDVAGGRGEDEGRNDRTDATVQKTGADGAAGARPRLGNGAGELHPAPTRDLAIGHQPNGHDDDSPRNLDNYRITDADRLGEGGLKQKFQQNIKAIEILRALDAEDRSAAPDEKALLVKYVGWGAMPQVFDVDSANWRKEQIQLSEILSDEEHRSARATTLNAHYTAPVVIQAMYQAAQRFGFQGGDILEPACGIGHFIGLMPEEMLRRSAITGIEIDPLTVRIARALYPGADIREQPFEKSKLTDESFDLAVSNVPFGDYTVHDPRWNEHKFPIHDYFFAAALDKVRPGGLLMFVTSRHTLDKLDSTLRGMLSEKAEFLGAIRLPNTAFKKNAGTEVTTDIVMLRKLRPGEPPRGRRGKQRWILPTTVRKSFPSTNTSPPILK
jgi:SAM-dependent methyltransferase